MFLISSLVILSSYFLLFVLSYFWVDLNLTLISWGPGNQVLERLKWLGYFNRPLSSRLYLAIILLLVLIQIYLLFSRLIYRESLRKLLILAGAVILLCSLAYPFLSHDIFSYLFDAKIVWHYQKNPYLYSPDQFTGDSWLRFMHWTHRTTPYGPIWIIYSLLPALFSFGRFVLNFYGLKLLNGLVFFLTGGLLLKITKTDKRVFAYWFFNPFLLIEFLVNAHNDLLMIALFFVSLFLWQKRKFSLAILTFLSLGAVKFITMLFLVWPLILFKNRRFWATWFVFFMMVGFAWEINRFQLWYFTWAFLALPLIAMTKFSWLIFFIFQALLLIFKYCPFLATGSWEGTSFFLFFQVSLVALGLFFLSLWPEFRKRIMGFLAKDK
ncbi:MAG: hypothetical protein PHX72_01735 [Candidatus Shapirobacteria bacterium]|nr:hypothetical protein [Candidatus Shapirobacteria bacterium]